MSRLYDWTPSGGLREGLQWHEGETWEDYRKRIAFGATRRGAKASKSIVGVRHVPMRRTARVIKQPTFGSYNRSTKELKFLNNDNVTITPPTGGQFFTSLNVIAQGTDENNRIGRKVFMQDIFLRVIITRPDINSAGFASDTVRLIIYLDKQTNGAAPTVLNILNTAEYKSFYNMSDIQRFKIYHDKFYTINATMDGQATSLSIETQKFVKINLTKLNVPIEYNDLDPSGTLATIRSNNFGVLWIGKFGNTITQMFIRTRFTD